MKVAILGCGPAGMVAAHVVATEIGCDFDIFSKRPAQSEMFGAQYLHEPIKGIDPGKPQHISYQLQGSILQYRKKVYGASYVGTVSPQNLEGNHDAYDIRRTYDELWRLYGSRVEDSGHINSGVLQAALNRYDKVLSTIPLNQVCRTPDRHRFQSQWVWAYGDAPDRGQYVETEIPDGTVLCNGKPYPTWYRASRIFGHATLEWSMTGAKPDLRVSEVRKPITNACSCWPDVGRIGRYGKWRKGILVHHAYRDTLRCLTGR